MAKKYKIFEVACEICGETFRRSALIGSPPRFCCKDCLNVSRAGKKHEKYTIPEYWFEPIKKMYASGVGKGQVGKMAKKIGVPRTKIYYFAKEKGWVPQTRSKDYAYFWSEKELSIVEKSGHYAPVTVQRKLKLAGFRRSVSAIEVKRSQLRACKNINGMTANELAECMGVDVHKILTAIKFKKIKAERRPGYEGLRVAFFIKANNIREYIKNWLPEINIGYCDKYWLIDLLAKE